MTLPEIVLPKIDLPFEMPILLHPSVDHFLIAIPVIVLLLELINLMMKKKAVGGVSFFLLVLTVLLSAGAYLTGLADGKEAFEGLNEVTKTALGEHKLLGTYLMLGSVLVLFLKLLAMTGNKVLKGIYIFILIAFVAVMFKQGTEGGDLVYVHGVNVKKVATLETHIEDLNDSIEDVREDLEAALKKSNDLNVEHNKTCSITAKDASKTEKTTSVVSGKEMPPFTPIKTELENVSEQNVTATVEEATQESEVVAEENASVTHKAFIESNHTMPETNATAEPIRIPTH